MRPSLAGTKIDRYAVEALIGRGGMGEVYRAVDDRLRRKVALKVLRPDKDQPDAVARLFREAQAAAALTHPNTVAIHDIGESDGIFYIVMELVSGQPLLAYVGDERISHARKLRWLTEIARALSAAHKAGVIHRDVKPSNVMVSDEDVAKVLDFGLAKPVEPKSFDFRTAVGRVVGTARYMAPEALAGVDADARSDQYSFGVTAYELLSGRYPSGGPLSEAQPLETFVSGITSDCSRVIARMMSLKADNRFKSLSDVIIAFEDVAANRPLRGSTSVMSAVKSPNTPKMPGAPSGAPSTAPTGSPESTWGPDTVRDPNVSHETDVLPPIVTPVVATGGPSTPKASATPLAPPAPAKAPPPEPKESESPSSPDLGRTQRQSAHQQAHAAMRTLLSREAPSDLKILIARGEAPPKKIEMAAVTVPLGAKDVRRDQAVGTTLTSGNAPRPAPPPPAAAPVVEARPHHSAPPAANVDSTPSKPSKSGRSGLLLAIIVVIVALISVGVAVAVAHRSTTPPPQPMNVAPEPAPSPLPTPATSLVPIVPSAPALTAAPVLTTTTTTKAKPRPAATPAPTQTSPNFL